jgi:hypothetical protein
MTVGVRAITRLPAARTLVAYCGLVSFLYGTDTVLFVGVSEHRLGTGPEGFGYLLAGLGVGGLLGAGFVNQAAGLSTRGDHLAGAPTSLPTALLAVIHAPDWRFRPVFRGATLVVDVLAITALQRASRLTSGPAVWRVLGFCAAVALGFLTPAVECAGPERRVVEMASRSHFWP